MVSEEALLRVIDEEVAQFGGVPRYLFMTTNDAAMYKLLTTDKEFPLSILKWMRSFVDCTNFVHNVRHRMSSVNPRAWCRVRRVCDNLAEYFGGE